MSDVAESLTQEIQRIGPVYTLATSASWFIVISNSHTHTHTHTHPPPHTYIYIYLIDILCMLRNISTCRYSIVSNRKLCLRVDHGMSTEAIHHAHDHARPCLLMSHSQSVNNAPVLLHYDTDNESCVR